MSKVRNPETSKSSTSSSLDELQLREATAEDNLAVGDLFKRSWCELALRMGLPVQDIDVTDLILSLAASWVVTRGEKIVGFLLLSGDLVSKIYVDPQEQGRGIGAMLFEQAIANGAKRLFVDEANSIARKFYESYGWRPNGNVIQGSVFPVPVLEYEYVNTSVK